MSAERRGEDIEFAVGEATQHAYLALPASGRGPGVLVIQEWWGLVPHIRDVCDRLAREGFVALAPDLYDGEATTDPDAASRLMMDLEIPRAVDALSACVAHLQNQHAVEGARVGCIGFCMGGQLALAAGCANPKIGAVVDCYGIHPNVRLDFDGLEAAVFGVFAENDEFVGPEAARALESELQAAGARARFNVYVGVQHAFLNDSRPDVYDAPTATEAWNDLLAFLRAELG
jgi:carboxymethylenebutenolidase